MARLKKQEQEKKVDEALEELAKIREKGTYKIRVTNGDIPVKYEYADLFYDVKDGSFYMHVKIGNKKVTLIEDIEE